LARGEDPSVHHVRALRRIMADHKLVARCLLKQLDLAEIEVERVDPLQDDVGEDLSDTLLSESEVLAADDGRVDEEESDTVGTVLIDDIQRVGVVLELFAHLLAIAGDERSTQSGTTDLRSEDKTSDDQVLPRRHIEEVRGEHKQGVEPTSGLVDTLSDEVGREALLESLLVLEGVVVLGVGHAGVRG